jgi:iron complex outermembrane receptor protein
MGKFPASICLENQRRFTAKQYYSSDLKFRVVRYYWQQEIGNNNDFLQQYNLGSGSSQYFWYSCLPIAFLARQSSNLKWEETTTYNAGLDLDCTTIE